ncbi:odorant receptor Or2-like isoform X2 [Cylas formicarius]|uniref:odorant receptor Or2-like isoform X2 n=1 Tax=Cylas formicarius TaxID=197179 RepID=UPI002958A361|nr:odorant receptor Or2-like isoform X2 [Cylas formicarius]
MAKLGENKFLFFTLRSAFYTGLVSGIWRQEQSLQRWAYKIAFWIVFYYLVAYHLTQWLMLTKLLTEPSLDFDEIIRNYFITSIYLMTLTKCAFIQGHKCQKFLTDILEFERKVYASNDTRLHSIYDRNVRLIRRTNVAFLSGFTLVFFFYVAAPLLRAGKIVVRNNSTILIKQLPISTWTPFDETEYTQAFAWVSCNCFLFTIYFILADTIMFSLIVFALCQIDVLKHSIKGIADSVDDIDRAMNDVQIKCIALHQEIIRYVLELNASIKSIMLLDFLQSSIQLAAIMFQLVSNFSLIQCILLGEFTLTLIGRLYIYYSNAHELMIQSSDIATAWFQSGWLGYPLKFRRNIIFCIQRSQQPLQLTIGNFQAVSLNSFISILKATYSFMTLLVTRG